MLFSSGTTGMAKAVCLSHKNCVTHSKMMMDPMFGTLAFGKNLLCVLPMFHIYGFIMAIDCLQRGAVFTVMPRFDLEAMLKAIQEQLYY
jgi:acyl-CoA synthetase (AMP-forming)/AMP-acid ligase II